MKALSRHQSASIDANSINGLMKVMRALESAVFPIDVDQMWNDCLPVLRQGDTDPGQDMMGFLTRLRSVLKELRHLYNTFSCLTSSLGKKMSSVEAKYKSMVLFHGVSTAPVDVLDRIFEVACSEDSRPAFDLSLVNKRFHDIVMGNPRLWNKISNLSPIKTSLGQLQVCLKRSKNAGLNIELDFDMDETITDGVEILGIAVPEASRWENIRYVMEGGGYWLDLFRDISRYCTGLNLPRLKSVMLSYPGSQYPEEDVPGAIIDHSEQLMHFYTTWYLPSLTNLKVYNLFPRPFLHCAPPLTTLTLDIKEDNNSTGIVRVYDMNLLLEFLRSSPLLETFCLRFRRFTPSTKDNDHTLPETVLPNLQTFDFTALFLTAQSLLPFMKALRLPSLRNLHVYVDADTEIINLGGNVWLDCVLPLSYEQYLNVVVFSYKTRSSKTVADLNCRPSYDILFAKLHNLRSFTLETPGSAPKIWSCHDAWTYMMLPKLEDISFVHCNALDEVELRSFKELAEKQDKWDTLKKVTFEECRSLSEGTVRSLFEGKDVTWKTFWGSFSFK